MTGSGKTRLYLELAQDALKLKQSSLILVPEIALTPQLAAEFQDLHDHVIIVHSGQTPAQRHLIWRNIRSSSHPWVVVGPRSCLFCQLKISV